MTFMTILRMKVQIKSFCIRANKLVMTKVLSENKSLTIIISLAMFLLPFLFVNFYIAKKSRRHGANKIIILR